MPIIGKPLSLKSFFIALFLIYLIGFLSHFLYLQKSVYGDGIFYYSYLHSFVIDRDLDFTNEYDHFRVTVPRTHEIMPENKYAVGPALLWFPNYLLTHRIIRGTGFGFFYQLTVGFTSFCYVFIGLLLLYKLGERFFGKNQSMLAILSLACGTNLLFYGSIDPVNSHGLSFFCVSLFLSLLFAKPFSWKILGITLGLVGLMRPQDMLVGLCAYPMLVRDKCRIKALFSYLIFTGLGFLPQYIVRFALYATIVSPYLLSNEGFNFLNPHVISVLFSLKNGLIIYSPILIFALIGMFGKWGKIAFFRPILIIVVALQLYLIASWSTWWQGASYGIRMFVGTLPLLLFPFGAFFRSFSEKILRQTSAFLLMIISLSILNAIMIIYTLLTLT